MSNLVRSYKRRENLSFLETTSDWNQGLKRQFRLCLAVGRQENFFKITKERYHLYYFPGYDIEELENQPLVQNPKLLEAKKAKKKLQVELAKLKRSLLRDLLLKREMLYLFPKINKDRHHLSMKCES